MAGCHLCGKLATDPGRGPSPWAKAVIGGEQVIVCPDCQQARPGWRTSAERCPECGSDRLGKALGDRVCRACGHQWSDEPFEI